MCDCIDRYNQAAHEQGMNVFIDAGHQINTVTGEIIKPRVPIPLCWDDTTKRKRGQSLPVWFALFCPLCGERYDAVEAKAP